jgi:hypothetical protein
MDAELQKWVAKGGEFVEREAPHLAQEIVAWNFTCGLVEAVIGLALLATTAIAGYAAWRFYKSSDRFEEGAGRAATALFLFMIALFAGIFGLVCTVEGTVKSLKSRYAPRVVIVETLLGQ